mmetsp:Transcript_35589/g.63589  ORF Transcript_35589/g.63589 Transcript_35589/m.63589 type:complete len:404 (-) Transcript_35589:237-1448(-)
MATGRSYAWIIGCTVCIISNFAMAWGLNIQKLSMMQNELRPIEDRRSPALQQLWIFGFLVYIIGNLGNFASLGLAPISVLAPLAVSSIVGNVMAAMALLGESFTMNDVVATLVMVLGTCLTVSYGNHNQSEELSLQQLGHLAQEPHFVVFTACFGAVALLLYGRIRRKLRHYDASLLYECFDVREVYVPRNSIDTLEHSLLLQQPERRRSNLYQSVHPQNPPEKPPPPIEVGIGYAVVSAQCGSYALLLSKIMAELLKIIPLLTQDLLKLFFVAVPVVGGWVLLAFWQVSMLNAGLRRGQSLLVVPTYYGVSIPLQILSGSLFFCEVPSHWGCFLGGTVLTMVGVYMLTRRAPADGTLGDQLDDEEPGLVAGYAFGSSEACSEIMDVPVCPEKAYVPHVTCID